MRFRNFLFCPLAREGDGAVRAGSVSRGRGAEAEVRREVKPKPEAPVCDRGEGAKKRLSFQMETEPFEWKQELHGTGHEVDQPVHGTDLVVGQILAVGAVDNAGVVGDGAVEDLDLAGLQLFVQLVAFLRS